MDRSIVRSSVVLCGLLALTGCQNSGGRPDAGPGPREGENLCDPSADGWDERPLWGQVVADNGIPNYKNPSQNINVSKSIRLWASLLQVVTNRMEDLSKAARSECICEGNQLAECEEGNTCIDVLQGKLNEFGANVNLPSADDIPDSAFGAVGIKKSECQQYCRAMLDNALCEATGDVQAWRKNDLLVGVRGLALKALTHVEWLDSFWDKVRSSDFQDKIAANKKNIERLNEAANDIDGALGQVDRFTEGFHIGGYSQERPDLWFCVPRAGGNVYAPLFELLDGKVSVGSRWRSGQAAKKIRGQFGWTTPVVRAFGVEIPMGLNLNLNTQINAFKLWDREKLLGLPVGDAGLDVSSVEAVAEYDALNVMEGDSWLPLMNDIAGADGVLSATDLLYDSYYPVRYSPDGSSTEEWPRDSDSNSPSNVATAVVGAGINWKHDFGDLLEAKDDSDSNPIEGTQKLLDKIKTPRKLGSSNFGITPYVRLGLSIELYNEASRLLDQIREKINDGLPAGTQPLTAAELSRDSEAWMQAPDVSRDLGLEGTVSPELGVQIGGSIQVPLVTVRANAGLGVRAAITPGFAGDTVDINRALADRLDDFGPTEGACTPEYPTVEQCSCSADAIPESTRRYACYLSATAAGVDGLVAPGGVVEPLAAAAADYVQCESYGTCIVNGQSQEDVRSIDCADVFVPYRHIISEVPNLTAEPEWVGDCHPLISGFETDDAAELAGDIRANPDLHSIFTYAATAIRLVAMLTGFIDARIEISAPFKIFGKRPKFGFNLHHDFAVDLGSTADVNFVKGLEADYESACNDPASFTLHESESNFVLAYDVEEEPYQQWCFGTVEDDTSYGDVPEQNEDTLAETINGFTTLGSEAATNLWSASELCVGGEPLLEVLQAPEHWTGMSCSLVGGGDVFDCGDLDALAAAGNCAAPNSTLGQMCGGGSSLCSMANGQVDISSLPTTIPPQYESGVESWFEGVGACIAALDIELSDEEQAFFDEATPCCGDGLVQGSESTDVGGCDDGNLVDGDGCSSSCRLEPGYTGGGGDGGETCDVCDEGEVRLNTTSCQGDHVLSTREECQGCAWVDVQEVEWCESEHWCEPGTTHCTPCEDEWESVHCTPL